LNLITFN